MNDKEIEVLKLEVEKYKCVVKQQAEEIDTFAFHMQQAYENGYQDAVKKMRNFMKKHMSKYERK